MLNKGATIVVLVFITFLAFINIYQNDFISDDIEGIVKNKELGNLTLSLKQLAPVSVINSSIFLLFGQGVPYYHFASVAIHITNVLLVYYLLCLISNKKLAFFSALLFSVHPVHAEAVTWISGKPYVLYSFFLLTSLILFIKSLTGKKLLLIFSLLGYLLALLTTEKALMFPILICLYLFCYKSLKTHLKEVGIFFIITFLYGLTLIWRLPERIAAINPSYGPAALTYNPVLQVSTAVSSYLELFFAPVNLTFYHDTSELSPSVLGFKILVTILFFIVALILLRKNKLLFFALSFFFISISPTLIPISVGWVVAERYFYLGSMGLCIFLAYIILKLKKFSNYIMTGILAVFLILTLYRNSQWQSEDTMWPATLKMAPGVPVAHNNMGDYYARHGDLDSALKEFSIAINLRGGIYPEALHNLANTYSLKGDLVKAEFYYLKAVEINPNQIETYMELVSLYKSLNNQVKAEEYYQKVLKLSK